MWEDIEIGLRAEMPTGEVKDASVGDSMDVRIR